MNEAIQGREHEGLDEQRRIRRWRREQFVTMGFSPAEARRLTTASVDLGDMRRLLRAGCPLDTARHILL